MPGYFGGSLAAHNHTATPGDGGAITNLSVSGTVTAGGAIAGASLGVTGAVVAGGDVSGTNLHATAGTVDETSTPTGAAMCPRLDQMAVWALLG